MLSIKTFLGTGVVLLVISAAVFLIVVRMLKNKKAGKTSCSCGCKNCAMSDICHRR